MYRLTDGKIPLIGVGGISNGVQAYAKIRAGASLIQLYSAMVYQGPRIALVIAEELASLIKKDRFSSMSEAIGADHR
jgi:dihydroorotate dehydrogenase